MRLAILTTQTNCAEAATHPGRSEGRFRMKPYLLTCTCVGVYPGRVEPASPIALTTSRTEAFQARRSSASSLGIFNQSFLHRAWPKTRGPEIGSRSALVVGCSHRCTSVRFTGGLIIKLGIKKGAWCRGTPSKAPKSRTPLHSILSVSAGDVEGPESYLHITKMR